MHNEQGQKVLVGGVLCNIKARILMQTGLSRRHVIGPGRPRICRPAFSHFDSVGKLLSQEPDEPSAIPESMARPHRQLVRPRTPPLA
jgi:hypothetical protein